MSYNVIAYQVDAEKVKAVWGSKDQQFLDRFLSKYRDEIAEQEEQLDVKGYAACMANIINGTSSAEDDEDNFIYGYLYEMLCQEFGEMVRHDDFLDIMEDVTPSNHKAFIPIPKNDDWPEFYSVPLEELEQGRQVFLGSDEPYTKETSYIQTVNFIFDTAVQNHKALVFFGY